MEIFASSSADDTSAQSSPIDEEETFQKWMSEIQGFENSRHMRLADIYKFACEICGNHAAGKHYGANTCNGCRGFFRRTVSKGTGVNYNCTNGNRQCLMSFKQKKFCKGCRWDRCLRVGMDVRRIQKQGEARLIIDEGRMKPSSLSQPIMVVDDCTSLKGMQTLNISHLLEAYYSSCNLARNSVEIPQVDAITLASDFTTFVRGHHNALHAYLFMMVEWGKRIKGFRDLTVEDQIILFRSFGRKHVCLQTAFETIRLPKSSEQSNLVCGYGKVTMPKQSMEMGLFKIEKDMEEICKSMTDMFPLLIEPIKDITDEEFICFETLFLLDPFVQGLSEPQKVMNLRRSVQSIVMGEKAMNPNLPFHVMDLFHLLPVIDNYSNLGVKFARDSSFFSPLGKCSKLVNDLFLGY